MERELVFRAIKQKCGPTCQGEWSRAVWRIFDNRDYVVRIMFIPIWDEVKEGTPGRKSMTILGNMDKKSFSELKSLLQQRQWREPYSESGECDGVAWGIKYFPPDGELPNSSGKSDYTDGQELFERIVNLLPESDILSWPAFA